MHEILPFLFLLSECFPSRLPFFFLSEIHKANWAVNRKVGGSREAKNEAREEKFFNRTYNCYVCISLTLTISHAKIRDVQ